MNISCMRGPAWKIPTPGMVEGHGSRQTCRRWSSRTYKNANRLDTLIQVGHEREMRVYASCSGGEGARKLTFSVTASISAPCLDASLVGLRSDSGQRNSPGLNAQPGAPARAGASHGACNAPECSPRLAQMRPSSQPTVHRLLKKHCDECGTGDAWQAGHDAVIRVLCAVGVTLCVSDNQKLR